MVPLRARFTTGLAGNIGGQGVLLAVQTLCQIALVAVLTRLWSAAEFGTWLLALASVAYLLLADLGTVLSTGNAMAGDVGAGEERRAQARFAAMWRGVVGASAAVALAATLAVLVVRPDLAIPAALLAGYAIATFATNGWMMGLRATGHFPRGAVLSAVGVAVETALAGGAAWAGYGLAGALAGLVAGRALTALVLAFTLKRKAGWPVFGRADGAVRWRDALPPGLAILGIAIGGTLAVQGALYAVGAAAGAAVVAAYGASRTLARSGAQLSGVLVQGAMPELSRARATGDTARKAELVAATLVATLVLLALCWLAIAALGPWLVDLWTGGTIRVGHGFLALLALATAFHALWMGVANLLTASDDHRPFAIGLIVAMGPALALTWWWTERFGLVGAAAAGVVAEGAVLALAFIVAFRRGLLDRKAVRAAPRLAMTMLRRKFARN